MKHRILLYSLIIVSATACSSIKEDRSVCPCLCSIDFTQVNPSIKQLHIWFFDYNGVLVCRDTLDSEEYGNPYEVEFKRGPVYFYVWGNAANNTIINEDSTLNSSLLKIKDAQADPLYYYKKCLYTEGERKYDVVIMNKEHAVINTVIVGVNALETPLKVEITGNTAGQYVDGRLIEAQIKTVSDSFSTLGNNTIYEFRIMRQSSIEDLKMSVKALSANQAFSMDDLPLGRWLKDIGYNMNDENLSDISVEVDISKGVVSIQIENWNMTEPVRIVL